MWQDRIALPPELSTQRGLVIKVASRFSGVATPTCDMDDIASYVVAGLCYAASTYRSELSPWVPWALRCIEQHLYKILPRECGCVRVPPKKGYNAESNALRLAALRRGLELDAPIYDGQFTLKDQLRDTAAPVWEQVDARLCDRGAYCRFLLTRYTSESERPWLFACYGIYPYRRMTQQEIADKAGCKRQWVGFKVQQTIRKLRRNHELRRRFELLDNAFPAGRYG